MKKVGCLSTILFCLIVILLGCRDTSSDNDSTLGNGVSFSLDGLSFKMIPVQGGYTFPACSDDSGIRTVLEDYLLGETEVTWELWETVYLWATAHGYTFANTGMKEAGSGSGFTNQHPVVDISRRDAIIWCNALTEYYNTLNGTNLDYVYYSNDDYTSPLKTASNNKSVDANPCSEDMPYIKADKNGNTDMSECTARGFRLPTGNEWELAARYRGSDKTNVVTGINGEIDFSNPADGVYWTKGNPASNAGTFYDDVTDSNPVDSILDGKSANDTVAVYMYYWDGDSWELTASGDPRSAEVKSLQKNTLGFYDMSGNAFEICIDLISGQYTSLRGGSWRSQADTLQVGEISLTNPFDAIASMGLRVAKNQ